MHLYMHTDAHVKTKTPVKYHYYISNSASNILKILRGDFGSNGTDEITSAILIQFQRSISYAPGAYSFPLHQSVF